AALVPAVAGEILRDQVDLEDALGGERARLGDDVVDRAAALRAPELRDDAERAGAIAALGDLDVGAAAGADPDPRRVVIVDVRRRLGDADHGERAPGPPRLARRRAPGRRGRGRGRGRDRLGEGLEVVRAEDVIDLGDVLRE